MSEEKRKRKARKILIDRFACFFFGASLSCFITSIVWMVSV